MKFFTVSLFVLLSSAILGGSFATPAHTHLGGLVGGVLGTVGDVVDGAANTVGGVVDDLQNVVGKVVESLSDVLHKLPVVVDGVLNAVNELVKETGKVLVFRVHGLVDNILNFTTEVLGHIITININIENFQIYFDNHLIGTILNNGSIVDLQNNLIGMCDREHGLVVIVGDTVEDLVGNLGIVLSNLLHSLDVTLGGTIGKLQEALGKISVALRQALADLPSATAKVLNNLTEELHETGKAVVCAVGKVVDKIISFKDLSGEIVFSVNSETFEVTCAGHTIGHMNEDGSIVDSDGNVIGCLIEGLLIVVGPIVETLHGLLHDVAHAAQNGLGGLLDVLG